MKYVNEYRVRVVEVNFNDVESVLKEYDGLGYYVSEMKPLYIANTPYALIVHFAKRGD